MSVVHIDYEQFKDTIVNLVFVDRTYVCVLPGLDLTRRAHLSKPQQERNVPVDDRAPSSICKSRSHTPYAVNGLGYI